MSLKVKWQKSFPHHWEIVPAKRLFPESKARAAENDEQLSATQDYGVIPQSEFMRLAGRRVVQLNSNQHLRKRVEIGDFVISMRSFQGGLERAWAEGGIRSSYVVLKPRASLILGYYQYLFKSAEYIQALQSTANFIRDGQDMSYQDFILIDLPLPPNEEQFSIAAFLDYETARIDQLIAKQQQLVELLKEKRQAVISHAVTKGLNPNAPMKDSGVEWLGQVPEHWRLVKLKWLAKTTSGSTPNTAEQEKYYNEGQYPWVRTTDLNNGTLTETPIRITEQAIRDTACSILPIGSVLIAMYGGAGSIGKHALLHIPATTNQAVCAILPKDCIVSEYLNIFADFQRPFWMVGAEGTRKDPNIGQDHIRDMLLPLPPKQEQMDIYASLEKHEALFEAAERSAVSMIELLQERRTALISAAVTGKIDLRGWQPPKSEVAA